ncbi:MAG TPA: hypothetical protein PKD10_17230 [Paracoccaceae bacterium]|nr:hypothetical protein [Paracoccaceae bacterium]HMO72636.1 hypothetical protein [Paracoccaceae bacterium]
MFRDPTLSVACTVRSVRSDAQPVATRAIRARPDEAVAFGASRAVARTERLDLPVAGLPALAEGDEIEIGDAVYVVADAPRRDREHLVWRATVRQVA